MHTDETVCISSNKYEEQQSIVFTCMQNMYSMRAREIERERVKEGKNIRERAYMKACRACVRVCVCVCVCVIQ